MQPGACSSPPPSATPQAPRFPILMLDERRLTPSLGYIFNDRWLDPCESLVSILWKFERVNALPGHIIARLMGPNIDPYEGVVPQPDTIDIGRLHATLGVRTAVLHMALQQPSQRRRYSPIFRHCRRCMTRGYHSVLHQMECIRTCPAHHRQLESACLRCGYEAPYVVNVRLLESPYRCAECGKSYGGGGWSPDAPRPMKTEFRKAFTRRYFERHLG